MLIKKHDVHRLTPKIFLSVKLGAECSAKIILQVKNGNIQLMRLGYTHLIAIKKDRFTTEKRGEKDLTCWFRENKESSDKKVL